MLLQRSVIRTVTFVVAAASTTAAFAQAVTYRTVASTTDTSVPGAPEGAEWSLFRAPAINGCGQTAFVADLLGTLEFRGLWREGPDGLERLLTIGEATSIGTILDFALVPVNIADNGHVLVVLNIQGVGNAAVIVTAPSEIVPVAVPGMAVPGRAGLSVGSVIDLGRGPFFSNTGVAAVTVATVGGDVGAEAVIVGDAGGLTTPLATGDPVPGAMNGETVKFVGARGIADNGALAYQLSGIVGQDEKEQVFFGAPNPALVYNGLVDAFSTEGGAIAVSDQLTGQAGLSVLSNLSGGLEIVAGPTIADPTEPGAFFTDARDPALGTGGGLAFYGMITEPPPFDDNTGIWLFVNGGVELVVRGDTLLPGSSEAIGQFSRPVIMESNTVVFNATDGVFARLPDGTLVGVAASGQSFDFGGVTTNIASTSGLQDIFDPSRGGVGGNDGKPTMAAADHVACIVSGFAFIPSAVIVAEIDVPVQGCDEDLDNSGAVGSTDLNIVLAAFGCTGGGCAGDIDGDGDTDSADLNQLLASFGSTCP